jgi:tetratricopeptide (TPR) repeat protein
MSTTPRIVLIVVGACFVLSALPQIAQADEAEAHYRMALDFKKKGDIARAIVEARTAVRLRPEHASAQFTLGSLLRRRKDYQGALKAFERVIALSPKHAPGYAMAGAMLMRL